MLIHNGILADRATQSTGDKGICDALAEPIDRHVPNSECKILHAKPAWLLDGNSPFCVSSRTVC